MADPGHGSESPTAEKARAAGFRRDLTRLLAMSFSAGELSKFAEQWRVFTDREGSSEDCARSLVRTLEARRELGALVATLRTHKPLVDWPDPPPAPTVPGAPFSPFAPPEAQGSDASSPSSRAPGERDADSDAPPPSAPRSELRREAPLLDPYLDEEEDTTALPSLGRWLVLAAVGLGGAVAGAAAMYFLHPARVPAEAPPEVAPLSQQAAALLRDRVQAVALACDVPSDGDSAREILATAFAECGTPPVRPNRASTPDPAPVSTPAPLVAPARPALPGRGPRSTPESGSGCLDACRAVYTDCAKSACGAEPESAAEYTTYQRCLHECQQRSGRCRLSCR